MSFFVFGLSLVISFIAYFLFLDEITLWRFIAFGAGSAVALFLFYPLVRGIRAGDMIMVPIWKEIETPFMEESYVDTVPTIAMENGRKDKAIEVRLGDGTRGLVKLLHYGVLSLPEGRLLELEKPLTDLSST